MGRPRGHVIVFVGLALAMLGAGPGGSARVVDVRIGQHDELTRVVIELDSASGHRIERKTGRDGGTLAVHVGARADRRRIVSRSPLVGSVTITPEEAGTVALIALREPGLDYSEMLLDAPPRIVIDVQRAASSRAGSGPGALPGLPVSKTTAPPGEPVAPAAEDVVAPVPPTAQRGAGEGHGSVAPPASYRALVAEQQARGQQAIPTDPPTPEQAGAADSTVREALPAEVQPAPASVSPPRLAAPTTGASGASTAESLAAPPAAAPSATPSPTLASPARPSVPAAPPAVGSGPAQAGDRLRRIDPATALLVLAAIAGVAIAYRRIALRRTRRLALAHADDELAIFGDAGHAAAGDALATDPEAESPAPAESPALTLVRSPGEPGAPEPVAPEDAPGQGWQTIAIPLPEPEIAALPFEASGSANTYPAPPAELASDAAAAAPDSEITPALEESRVSGLTDRIASLERQVADLLDARERLERFAAAQNEELRVQRAAIARTQRVLRGMARPEDSTGEAGTQPSLPLSGE